MSSSVYVSAWKWRSEDNMLDSVFFIRDRWNCLTFRQVLLPTKASLFLMVNTVSIIQIKHNFLSPCCYFTSFSVKLYRPTETELLVSPFMSVSGKTAVTEDDETQRTKRCSLQTRHTTWEMWEGAGGMVRRLAPLAEDPGSLPSAHI